MVKTSSFFSRRNRWILTLMAQLVIYFYIGVGAAKGNKPGVSEENRAMALWLNPGAYGYREKLGDPNSPSLWDPTDWKEWVLLTAVFVTFGITFYLFRRDEGDDPIWLTLVKTFIVWSHTGLLLLLLPINKFHKRFLYNFRVALARVVEEPAKELFLAFVFIVLFPLPGAEDSTIAERYTWLAIKMGIFYIFQSVMLGAPTYRVEPPNKEKAVGMSGKEARYYALIIIVTLVAILIEKFIAQSTSHGLGKAESAKTV